MKKIIYTSAVATLALLECLTDHGIRKNDIKSTTGIDPSVMDDPDIRIPLKQYLKLWQMAVDVTGDPSLGIHLREKFGRNITHFVIHIIINSRTVIEALENWKRYFNLICEVNKIEFKIGEHLEIIHHITSPNYQNTWMPEHSLSIMMRWGRSLLGSNLNALEVQFKHANPSSEETYRKVFQCPVYFNQPKNAIIFPLQVLEYRMNKTDPHLQAYLKRHAEEIIELNHSDDFSNVNLIKKIIVDHISSGNLDADLVSQKLGSSRSSIHRKLKKEGTTFIKLLQETKQKLAESYLKQGMTASQTAMLLGYSETSNFQHAFKRWTGYSPGKFKKSIDLISKNDSRLLS